MAKRYSNTWTRMTDSDGGSGLGLTTSQESEHARFMDYHCAETCACGGEFRFHPTVGVMQCPKCGQMKVEC